MLADAVAADLNTVEFADSDATDASLDWSVTDDPLPFSGDMIARLRKGTPNDVAGRLAAMNTEVNHDPRH